MQKSYVYFMKHKDDNRIKIGKANDMPRRWNQLGNNFDFNSSYFKECKSEKEAYALEKLLHSSFVEFRLKLEGKFDGSTEWFEARCLPVILKLVSDVMPVDLQEKVTKERKSKGSTLHQNWPWDFICLLRTIKSKIEVVNYNTLRVVGGEFLLYTGMMFDFGVKPYARAVYGYSVEEDHCLLTVDREFMYKFIVPFLEGDFDND